MTTATDFGAWLRHLRDERGLTQDGLAEAAGCAAETVRSFESGRRRPSRPMAERLADVLGVAPDDREAFVRLARAPGGSAAPPVHEGPAGAPRPWARPHAHLPPDALIGRGAELGAIRRALLDEGRRLVTLLGPGGIGKTRLALQAAADLAPAFDGQAAFVSLAPAASAAHAITAVAEAVGCLLPGGRPPEEALVGWLRDRRLLLTLDNLEHLLGERDAERLGALVGGILREAPGVSVLATSRERLRMRGEWVVEVAALGVPAGDSPGALERSEAAQLFVERARQVAGAFALTRESRPAVARICRTLGGVPLAIELAAGWVRALPPDEIAAEVSRGLDLLSAGGRDLPPRHQSIAAVIEHSWRLLAPEERRLLMRLSAFAGGGTREAVEAVAGLAPQAALPLLAALVDKSLARRWRDPAGATRFDLHDLVRQFAAARLAEDPGREEALSRHAAHYAAWVAGQDSALKSDRQRAAVRAITAEVDNVRAAWAWACGRGDAGLLRSMLLTLDWFYEVRGWHPEAAAAFAQGQAALRGAALSEGAGPDVRRCYWLLVGREGWHMLRHQPARAAAQLSEAVAALRQLPGGDHVHCIKGLAYLRIFSGDYAAAEALLAETLALAEESGDTWQRSVALVVRAVMEVLRSEPEVARARLLAALGAARDPGDPRPVAMALSYLAGAELALGQVGPAERAARECLVLAAEHGDRFQMSLALQALGMVALERGDEAAGAWSFDEALRLAREIGDRWLESQALGHLGQLDDRRGMAAEARLRLRRSLEVSAAAPLPFGLDSLARLAVRELSSRPAAALAALDIVRRHPLTRPQTRAEAEARYREAAASASPEILAEAAALAEARTGAHPATLAELF